MVAPLKRWISDFGTPTEWRALDASGHPTGETFLIPRYGVWEAGGYHRKPEVIRTSDDLPALFAEFDLTPSEVHLLSRGAASAAADSSLAES